MPSPTLGRSNLLDLRAGSEHWKPRAHWRGQSAAQRLSAALRRFLDLQAASIWNDLRILLPSVEGDLLDVGSGAQPYRDILGPRARYRAIDEVGATDHFDYAVPDTTYFEGVRWPVDDHSVDVVLSTETLEHVPDSATFLSEAARSLRAGGQLILTVPFAARWHYIPHDYWRFTPSGLQRLLQAAGFDDIAIFARGNAVTVACYKVMAVFLPMLIGLPGGLLKRVSGHVIGVLSLPLIVALAGLGQMSLAFGGGADCLGYTVTAVAAGSTAGRGANP